MADTPTTLFDAPQASRGHAHPAVERRFRRKSDKLLTVDRALLAGIFAAGVWYATTDMRNGNAIERVVALERREEQRRDRDEQRAAEIAVHDREIAVVRTQLEEIDRRTENIEKGMSALAESTARAVNRLQERR